MRVVSLLELGSGELDESGFSFAEVHHVAPDLAFFKCLRIADNQEEMPRPGNSNIKPPFIDQETKNPEDLKELARIEREAQLGSSKNNKEETSLVSTAQIAAQLDRKKRLDTFDRFNEDFVSAYMADRYHKTLPEKNKAMQ